jgi:hypothetical protein
VAEWRLNLRLENHLRPSYKENNEENGSNRRNVGLIAIQSQTQLLAGEIIIKLQVISQTYVGFRTLTYNKITVEYPSLS